METLKNTALPLSKISIPSYNPAEYVCTKGLAKILGVSEEWLEIGRCKGYGPPFVRLTKRLVRYRLEDIEAWMKERTYRSTSEADANGGRHA